LLDNRRRYAIRKLVVVNFGQPESEVVNSVAPNPFRDAFTVSLVLARPQAIQLQMVDQKGGVLYSKNLRAQAGNNSLWISDLVKLQSGVYFLRVITETGVLQQKIIKE